MYLQSIPRCLANPPPRWESQVGIRIEELAQVSERLKALGFKEVRLLKYPFNPNIPDPDLQMHATLEVIGENLSDENLTTGAEIFLTDLAKV